MEILIAGASGFIGSALVKKLQIKHSLTLVGRNLNKLKQQFSSHAENSYVLKTWEELSSLNALNYDVIINLSGYNISASRWNEKTKNKIIDSRVNTTKTLVNWIIDQKANPHFICANAVGIYGLQKNNDLNSLDEDSLIDFNNPKDFVSEVGIAWQNALNQALDYGMKVTSLRFGVVLKRAEGMLKKLTPSFYFGLGSVIGDGSQVISWIHIEDLVAIVEFILKNSDLENLTGAVNVTSSYPVTQRQFAKTLASIMKRPMFLKMPGFLINLLFGEMGRELLLHGQRVVPMKLLKAGYKFKYPKLRDALKREF